MQARANRVACAVEVEGVEGAGEVLEDDVRYVDVMRNQHLQGRRQLLTRHLPTFVYSQLLQLSRKITRPCICYLPTSYISVCVCECMCVCVCVCVCCCCVYVRMCCVWCDMCYVLRDVWCILCVLCCVLCGIVCVMLMGIRKGRRIRLMFKSVKERGKSFIAVSVRCPQPVRSNRFNFGGRCTKPFSEI